MQKTHQTAVVVIPPREVWPPIQAIRERYDRHAHRWVMPHVTLLYPFRPHEAFPLAAKQLDAACAALAPFPVRLTSLRAFAHGRGSFTLWLAPEPAEALVHLQATLQSLFPDCDDVGRFPQGFTPHLSVAQARGQAMLAQLQGTLQHAWQPLSFVCEAIHLIWRPPPPEDVFRVDRTIPLGR